MPSFAPHLVSDGGGRIVVDLWGGTATFDGSDDDEAGIPGVEGDWQQDTIINVMSTTKTMAALVCLMLADRGELDLYEPIATYWPEFAANGKDRIATRHILSHTAGLAGWDEPLDETDLFDHDKLVRLLAAQAPWWEPSTQSAYHADTQGYLLGEIVKRVSPSWRRRMSSEMSSPDNRRWCCTTGSALRVGIGRPSTTGRSPLIARNASRGFESRP